MDRKLERLQELSLAIKNARAIKEMSETDGWKTVMLPLLNKSISDCIGGYEDGEWTDALIGTKFGDPELPYIMAYRRALILVTRFVSEISSQLDILEKEYKTLSEDKEQPYQKSEYEHE